MRSSASLLSRLALQRAPLALALPLLAAYAPEAFCSARLHVFARRSTTADHAAVEVSDGATVAALKRAVIAELRLDVAPDCVRLLREGGGGGAPVPLVGRGTLAGQQVFEGDSVLVEVTAAPAVAPMPLLTFDANPAASAAVEFAGLKRSTLLTQFSLAARSALVGAECAASGTRMWRLPDPALPAQPLTWPLLDARALVERDFYARFLSESQWLDSFSGPQRKVAVLGQPGIGKSSFGVWLLTQLLRSGRTVVYSRNCTRAGTAPVVLHYVFHAGAAFETSSADLGVLDALLDERSVVHICDGLPPRMRDKCHKVLITSPDPLVWGWFVNKEFATPAHFPPYAYAEMEALREAELGAALPQETMDLRVRAWGLSTRAVFSPNQRAVGDGVLQALGDRSLEELQKAMNEVRFCAGGAASDTPHSLFMLQADRETLRSRGVALRSEAVAQRVARQAVLLSRDTLIPALKHLLAGRHTGTIAGTAFEMAVVEELGRRGSKDCPVRALLHGPSPKGKKTTPVAAAGAPWQPLLASSPAIQHFVTLAELAQKCSSGAWSLGQQYFKPRSSIIAAIDFIGPGLVLFQVTVNSSSHDLKVTCGRSEGEGLLALYLSLLPLLPERWAAREHHLDVCFVVPAGSARDWKPQALVLHQPSAAPGKAQAAAAAALRHAVSIVGCKGGGTGFSVDGRAVEVRQYVMEMPEAVFDSWQSQPAPLRDAIDEASESSLAHS
jgi:hypothetical protein